MDGWRLRAAWSGCETSPAVGNRGGSRRAVGLGSAATKGRAPATHERRPMRRCRALAASDADERQEAATAVRRIARGSFGGWVQPLQEVRANVRAVVRAPRQRERDRRTGPAPDREVVPVGGGAPRSRFARNHRQRRGQLDAAVAGPRGRDVCFAALSGITRRATTLRAGLRSCGAATRVASGNPGLKEAER